jgi:uncharacterized surface protein with fasciclin (FAS1) repeats
MVITHVTHALNGAQATLFVPTDEAFSLLLAARAELSVYLNTSDLAAALAGYHGKRCMHQW